MTIEFDSASYIEQETVIRWSPGDDLAHVWTNVPHHARHFDKDERYTLKSSSPDGAFFTIPKTEYNPVKGAKNRRKMTDEQRKVASERMKAIQKGRSR